MRAQHRWGWCTTGSAAHAWAIIVGGGTHEDRETASKAGMRKRFSHSKTHMYRIPTGDGTQAGGTDGWGLCRNQQSCGGGA